MAPYDDRHPHVVVVGAGIAGLAAAEELHRVAPWARVTVLDAAPGIGGRLAVGRVAGLDVDLGAESLLARRPEAVDLAHRVGLAADLVHPAAGTALVATRGALRPLPAGTVLGVPTRPRALAGLLTPAQRARTLADAVLPGLPLDPGADVAVGALVERRLGGAVVDRLVEPLLAGVYAGHARALSLAMTVPALHAAAGRERTLVAAARAAAGTPGAGGPVFAGIRGGVGRLPGAVAAASGATVRTRTTVRELHRTPDGWRLVCGPVAAPEALDADAVVLAVPAAPAARLLAPHAPAAAAELAGLSYASVAIVTLAVPAAALAHLSGSGVLVPPVEHRAVKAVTFSSAKWSWLGQPAAADGLAVLRASVGRAGEQAVLQRDDAELVTLVRDDLADVLGVRGEPVDALVSRWGGALPQYLPGHPALVERVRRAVAGLPGLAVCGAAYDGVGVPACIDSARRAVGRVQGSIGATGARLSS